MTTTDHRIDFVTAESAKVFEADKATADAAYEVAIAPLAEDGYPQPLDRYDPARTVAARAHSRALDAATARHRARVALAEGDILGAPQAIDVGGRQVVPSTVVVDGFGRPQVDVMGNPVKPLFSAEDAAAAREWLAKLKIPSAVTPAPAAAVTREHVRKVEGEVLEMLARAYIADPARIATLINGAK